MLPFCHSHLFSALSAVTFYHSPVALPVLPFYHFNYFPSIERLVVLVSLVSVFVVVMLVILVMTPRRVALGSLPGTAIQAIKVLLANLASLGIHVVIDIWPILISLMCLGLGAARP